MSKKVYLSLFVVLMLIAGVEANAQMQKLPTQPAPLKGTPMNSIYQQYPDLEIVNIPSQYSPNMGDYCSLNIDNNLTVYFKNNGKSIDSSTEISADFQLDVPLNNPYSPPSLPPVARGYCVILSLPSGQTRSCTLALIAGYLDSVCHRMDCPFTLTIDPTNKVKEANEANNVIHGVCKKTYIDLAASNVEATANCNAKTISFKPVVTNLGTITHQGGFYWRIKTTSPSGKVCLNPGQGNVINQSVLVPQQVRIAPNTSYKPDSQICQSLPLENGTYALELWIGYGNEIYDDNRSNDYVRIERPVRCP